MRCLLVKPCGRARREGSEDSLPLAALAALTGDAGRIQRGREPAAGATTAAARISSATTRRSGSRWPQRTSRSSARRWSRELGRRARRRPGRAPARRRRALEGDGVGDALGQRGALLVGRAQRGQRARAGGPRPAPRARAARAGRAGGRSAPRRAPAGRSPSRSGAAPTRSRRARGVRRAIRRAERAQLVLLVGRDGERPPARWPSAPSANGCQAPPPVRVQASGPKAKRAGLVQAQRGEQPAQSHARVARPARRRRARASQRSTASRCGAPRARRPQRLGRHVVGERVAADERRGRRPARPPADSTSRPSSGAMTTVSVRPWKTACLELGVGAAEALGRQLEVGGVLERRVRGSTRSAASARSRPSRGTGAPARAAGRRRARRTPTAR